MPDLGRLLIIDDDQDFCSDLAMVFSPRLSTAVAHDGPSGLRMAEESGADVVLLDVGFAGGGMDGLEVLERLRALDHPPVVIMLSGAKDMQTVVQAIKAGAYHYMVKPADVSQLDNLINKALEDRLRLNQLQAMQDEVNRLTGNFIAGDDKTYALLERIRKVAPTDTTVLITGESGVGKEMVARRIHAESRRRDKPILSLNCGAIPAELIESEIFGHTRGSFTGAASARVGKLEQAAGGHLFLDEIGASPDPLQTKLLRALGEGVFTRLGENREISMTCRILAATNDNLEDAVAAGRFRDALYFRLNRYRLVIPPLRERPGDIEPLALHFLSAFCLRFHKEIDGYSPAAMAALQRDAWKGNIRELKNRIETAVIESEGPTLTLRDVQKRSRPTGAAAKTRYKEAMADFQREFFTARLQETAGNVTRAAENCGLTRQQLQKKLNQFGISADEFRI